MLFIDVAVVTFAAHCAYLDSRIGTGYLVAPAPESDLAAPTTSLVEATGSSLYAADLRHALGYLSEEGWGLLLDENGDVEQAGRTADGGAVLCLYGEPAAGEPCLESLSRSLTALDIAVGLDDRRRRAAQTS
ncbi:hypothetical protein ACIBL3_45980 [Kribbella sp. NPDC050124]|uniref:hypothetical protein n=1 Tax=Kribbella sp. NPDC050124 TaxID=3364114 RepID=UPI0037B35340